MRHDVRFFVPALLAWAVTVVLVGQPELSIPVAVGAALVFVAYWMVQLWRLRRVGASERSASASIPKLLAIVGSLACALVAVLGFRISVETQLRQPEVIQEALERHETVVWSGTITSSPETKQTAFGPSQAQAEVILKSLTRDGSTTALSLPVRIRGEPALFAGGMIGTELSGEGIFSPAPNTARLAPPFLLASDVTIGETPVLLRIMHELRLTLNLEASRLDGWGSELIPGLAVGDTSLVSDELDEAMKTASLSHLTAVSGANCAIITGLMLFLGRKFGLARRWRVTLAVIFLTLFVTLVTPEPSVLRAAVMSVVTLVAMLSARKGAGLAALGSAICILLVLDPWQSVHFGFVLSVLATAGILVFTEPISQRLSRAMPEWLAVAFAVPVAAQLACQPALLQLQASLPTFGILANVLAAPAAPIATISGLLACVALPLWPWLGQFFTWLTWFPASWMALIAEVMSGLPAAQLPWIEGWLGALLLAVCSAIIGLAVFQRSSANATARSLMTRWVGVSTAVSLVLALAVVRPLVTAALRPNDWRVYQCDVGQGDALLIRGTTGTMLIDTGIDTQLIRNCVASAGVDRISLLILTHDDKDHVGGLAGVVDRVDTAIVSPPSGLNSREGRPALKPLSDENVPIAIGQSGMHGTLGDMRWHILAPRARAEVDSTNDASVIVRVEAPEMSLISLGDLGQAAQQKLLRESSLAPADVVKVSHHGSADQEPKLYQQLRASYGLISVGKENRYGHPTDELIQTLRDTQTVPLRTDQRGDIAIARSADGAWHLWQSSTVG